MTDKGKRQQRLDSEDAVFNRMLLWLAGAVVAELVVLAVRRLYVDMALGVEVALGLSWFFMVFRFAGLALAAGCAVWLVKWKKAGRSVALPLVCLAVSAVLWVISLLAYQFFDTGVQVLIYLPPAAAVLILVWFLYQRLFFFSALITGCGMAALWLCRQYYDGHPARVRIIFGVGFVLLGLAMLLAVKVKSGGGKLGSLRVLPEGSPYPVLYVTCAVTAVTMALALLLGAAAAFYLLFVLVGWLFVQAVIFTVKLM